SQSGFATTVCARGGIQLRSESGFRINFKNPLSLESKGYFVHGRVLQRLDKSYRNHTGFTFDACGAGLLGASKKTQPHPSNAPVRRSHDGYESSGNWWHAHLLARIPDD